MEKRVAWRFSRVLTKHELNNPVQYEFIIKLITLRVEKLMNIIR